MQPLRGPREFVLVRHAESLGNVADRVAHERAADRLEVDVRDADMKLSPLGEHQARALGRHVAQLPPQRRPTVAFSSPYARALGTARCALEPADLEVPLTVDERLRERELGIFDGMTPQGIRRTHPEEAARRRWLGKFYYRPPSGESWTDVVQRVRQFLLQLSSEPVADGTVWVFTHQAVILAFRVAFEGLSEQEILEVDASAPLANCSITRYECDGGGRWHLTCFGDTSGIEEEAPTTREQPAPDRGVEDGSA